MDNNTLWGLAIVAVVIVIGFFLYRGKASAELKAGPVSGKFEGSGAAPAKGNEKATSQPPVGSQPISQGVKVGKVTSSAGGVDITNHSAGGVDFGEADVKKDVKIDNREPTSGTPDPKALPPA